MTKERAIEIMVEEGQPDPFVNELLIGEMIDLDNLTEDQLRAVCRREPAKLLYHAAAALVELQLAKGTTRAQLLAEVIESDRKSPKLWKKTSPDPIPEPSDQGSS